MFRVEGYELRKHEKPQREKRLERKLIARMPGPNSPPLPDALRERMESDLDVNMVGTWMLCGSRRSLVDVDMVGTWMLCGNGQSLCGR